MNILHKRASNPAAALDGTELVYVAQLGADAVTTVQDMQTFITNGFLLISTAATYAAIPTLTTSCFVFVAVDETNDNQPTVYFFDGTNLNWLPSVGV